MVADSGFGAVVNHPSIVSLGGGACCQKNESYQDGNGELVGLHVVKLKFRLREASVLESTRSPVGRSSES